MRTLNRTRRTPISTRMIIMKEVIIDPMCDWVKPRYNIYSKLGVVNSIGSIAATVRLFIFLKYEYDRANGYPGTKTLKHYFHASLHFFIQLFRSNPGFIVSPLIQTGSRLSAWFWSVAQAFYLSQENQSFWFLLEKRKSADTTLNWADEMGKGAYAAVKLNVPIVRRLQNVQNVQKVHYQQIVDGFLYHDSFDSDSLKKSWN